MYKIIETKTNLVKNPNTKTTFIVKSIETNEVTDEQHDLATNDETCRWFRRLGGSETRQKGYTIKGYVCTKLISVSPDKQNKTIREYKFIRL